MTNPELFYDLPDDPYPAYRQLREASPVLALDSTKYLVTGYRGCLSVLRDPAASNDLRSGRAAQAGLAEPVDTELDQFDSFLYRDPPQHTRLRRAVVTALRDYPLDDAGKLEPSWRDSCSTPWSVPAGWTPSSTSESNCRPACRPGCSGYQRPTAPRLRAGRGISRSGWSRR
jgi:hypothetical protein